jgi:hypothetical protein
MAERVGEVGATRMARSSLRSVLYRRNSLAVEASEEAVLVRETTGWPKVLASPPQSGGSTGVHSEATEEAKCRACVARCRKGLNGSEESSSPFRTPEEGYRCDRAAGRCHCTERCGPSMRHTERNPHYAERSPRCA